MPDALQLLREDHQRVQEMFRQFENTDDQRERERIARQAVMELQVHALIEEEIFYPAVRRQTGSEMEEKMNEADEEHHVAEMLMDELSSMRSSDPHFQAKFMVLAESVKHHIQEEESEVLPKAAEAGRDRLEQLGGRMQERKMELMEQFQANGRMPATTRKRTTRGRTGGARRTTRTATTRTRARTAGTRTRATGGTRTTGARTRTTGTRTTGTRGRTSRSRTTAGARSTSRGTARGGTRTRGQAASTRGRARTGTARTTRARTGATRSRSTGTRSRRS